ncbi:MAG TPA: hypothetical protein VH105_22560 [Burkholderiales bacterium]|jgi:hypothetical protein|nr:hypothetical protein [Burkholderiales bacterium]
MAKTYDKRLDETILYIRNYDHPRANAAADATESAVYNNITYQVAIGDALTVGHYWSTSKDQRALTRAIVLIQIVRGQVSIANAQVHVHGGMPLHVVVLAYREMEVTELKRRLSQLLDATVAAPAIFSAGTWLEASQIPNIQQFYEIQTARQAHFLPQAAQVANAMTRDIYAQMVGRCGKLNWVATNPDPSNASKFQIWVQNGVNASENLDMNCWESVLYCAFQAGVMTAAQCTRLYGNYNPADRYENTRNIYGRDRPFAAAVKERGDILTWGMSPDRIDHMGLYLGTMPDANGTVEDYVGHLLSFNPVSTGIHHMVGRIHIEKVSVITANLPGYLNFITQPFWVAGSPTNAYFQALG